MITTEERATLKQIIANYSIASDAKDVQAHMQYYAENGYIDGGMRSKPKNAGMEEDLTQMFAMEGTLKRHFAMNHRFSRDQDAVVVDYLLLVVEGEQFPNVIATAEVKDKFIKENGEWKIAVHSINIDPAMFNLLKQQDTGIDSDAFNA
ncbi:nuclear transport factor 2 family protein [Maribacter sp. 2307ULW6-5]|uniref:nuclear transport factor 2 family protein n=1 Tax=Maribacter sp. 2307ULW6-5 TaxID=3386275 RepID=UPI0039BCF925